ncbi:winged helix-turn-helix transcriptional regulator [Pseudoroseomonas globiformis]|uniref:Winged helix-turn-helix transcriptional regulator n=1 Tax=Teichococcus globiformis TaxID=2307229 RepID=A0ABV7FUG8_9PROT
MKSEKITKESPRRSWYKDACAAAHALDLLGERWALLVMRELMFGPRRFGEIRANLPGISANVLTQRLEGLEEGGVIRRRRLPPPASAQVYELTEWGLESEPIFQALGRWGARSPLHDPAKPFSAASLLLSMRTMLEPDRAAGLTARIGLRLGAEDYGAVLKEGRITITTGPIERPDLVLGGPPPVLAALLYGGQALEALEASGAIQVTGDRDLARRLPALFPLPARSGG